jgi:hypothetical protein
VTEPDRTPGQPSVEAQWQARQRVWERKLRRLRLGAEPIGEQLARYRRATWMLTAVPLVIGAMFVGLFAAFDRPDIGLILASILLLPIVAIAWIDYGLLHRRATRYLRERAEYEGRRAAAGRE